MKEGVIYKITSPSGKVYIGQTNDIERRITMHKSLAKRDSQTKLHRSIRKYGWDSHEFELVRVEIDDREELNRLEIFYIEKLDTFRHGLNMTKGGDGISGMKHTKEFKEKMRERMTGEKNPFYGKQHSHEAMSLIKMKNTGRPMSVENKKKLSERAKGNTYALGTKRTDLEQMSERSRGNKYNLGRKQSQEEKDKRAKTQWKPVYSSVLGKVWESQKACAEELGYDNSTIGCMMKLPIPIIKNRFGLSFVGADFDINLIKNK